jgi:uncharacterized surface protein with fasciclin (FAS1) repeats
VRRPFPCEKEVIFCVCSKISASHPMKCRQQQCCNTAQCAESFRRTLNEEASSAELVRHRDRGVVGLSSVAMGSAQPKMEKDIVDTAVAAGSFKTLAAALQAADLVTTLKGKGPFTVFAPTDEAFAKLPEGTVENLLKPENKEKLKAILLYRVVAGKVTAKQVMKMDSAKTVNGQTVTIRVTDGKVMVNNATVTKADIEASNGVIHVIDTVLLPQ